jgi:hypothetical protein
MQENNWQEIEEKESIKIVFVGIFIIENFFL